MASSSWSSRARVTETRESDSQVFRHVYFTMSLSDCGLHRTRSVAIHTVECHIRNNNNECFFAQLDRTVVLT